MSKRILVVASTSSSALSIIPVLRKMEEQRCTFRIVSSDGANQHFKSAKVEVDRLLQTDHERAISHEIKLFHPNRILTGTSTQTGNGRRTTDQIVWEQGRDLGIHTVAILDSWDVLGPFSNLQSDGSIVFPDDHLVHLPDSITITDRNAWHLMLDAGFSQDKILVTGSPYVEQVFATASLIPNSSIKSGKTPLIVLPVCFDQKELRDWVFGMIDAAQRVLDVVLFR